MELTLSEIENLLKRLEALCDERRELEERFTSQETSRLARMQGALEKAERDGESEALERMRANFDALEAMQAKRIELETLRDLAEENELGKMRRELAKMKQAQNPQARERALERAKGFDAMEGDFQAILDAMRARAEKFLSRLEGEISALELRLSSSSSNR